MTTPSKMAIEVSHIIGSDAQSAQDILDKVDVGDLAKVVIALNNNDDLTILDIVAKYSVEKDDLVDECVKNVLEMIKQGSSRGIITELNQQQRRMFYGQIPPVVSKVIQKTIDMTPIKAWQEFAKLKGYGESALEECKVPHKQMIEDLIEDHLKKILTLNLGTIKKSKK